jgi:hypothetical protein
MRRASEIDWRNWFDWMPSGETWVSESERWDFLGVIMAEDFAGSWVGLDSEMGLSQGMALQAMIEGLKIRHPSAVVSTGIWQGLSVLGVRGRYRKPDGKPHSVDVFGIDDGVSVSVVCCRVYEDLIPDPWVPMLA